MEMEEENIEVQRKFGLFSVDMHIEMGGFCLNA